MTPSRKWSMVMIRSIIGALRAKTRRPSVAECVEANLIGRQLARSLHNPLLLQELVDSLNPEQLEALESVVAESCPDAHSNIRWPITGN